MRAIYLQEERERVAKAIAKAVKAGQKQPVCKHPGWEVIGENELGTWSNCVECGTTKVKG
jgi:hypothetical protein